MCRCCGETVDHLLLHCGKAYRLWCFVFRTFRITWVPSCTVLSSDNPKFGYNAATGDYEDLMTAGVIVEIKEPEPMPAGNPMDNSGYGFNLSFSARLVNKSNRVKY